MTRTRATVGLLLALVGSAQADTNAPVETPDSSAGNLAGQVVLGTLAGGVGVLAGVGVAYADTRGCRSEYCFVPYLLGGYAGYMLTVPAGVYAVGSTNEVTGSLAATYVGSIAGGLLGAGLTIKTESAVPAVIGPMLGALIGFNVTRKARRSPRDRHQLVPSASSNGQQAMIGIGGAF